MKPIAEILIEELRACMEKPFQKAEHPERVLVVDDDTDYANMMSELLEGQGYQVSIASQPSDALRSIISTIPFKFVLLDLNFGGRDNGITALEKMRALYPSLPIVIISGFIDSEFERVASGYGFKVFNKGQFDVEDLKHVVESYRKNEA